MIVISELSVFMQKRKREVKKKMSLCDIFLCKDNLKRDIAIVTISVIFSFLFIINNLPSVPEKIQENAPSYTEDITEQVIENEAENPTIDTANWKIYQNRWYGFELKYPEQWNKPLSKNAASGAKWEYRYQFRKKESDKSNPYTGFNVIVYNLKKVKELSNTDEFPTLKNEALNSSSICRETGVSMAENENYPAEQVYVALDDKCYNVAYFYTLIRDEYIYNIVPILMNGEKGVLQAEKEIIENFPEFISVSAAFSLIDIKRPKSVPPKPKITAPKPTMATRKDARGRRVCAKKNDNPSKSNKNKRKHMDMECCLDPDEYPNPWCYYPPEKYGKLLDKLK